MFDQWRSVTKSSRDQLERNDLRQVLDYGTWEDLLAQIQSNRSVGSVQEDFAMLVNGLLKLRTFTDTRMSQVFSKIDTSISWGLLRLILQVCFS